jgi:4-hydroxyproline epimerase
VQRIRVVDSHTGGEPTRVVLDLDLDLGRGPLAERAARLAAEHDHLRSAVVCEPRGSDVIVGAILVPPDDESSTAAVVYCNNVGLIGMCGHGTIGLVATLAHLGRIVPGTHRIETPVGTVEATLAADGAVSVRNVPSYRHAAGVEVRLPDGRPVRGDVAWGGNWFFIAPWPLEELVPGNVEALTELTWSMRQALRAEGVRAAGGAEVDHVELTAPVRDGSAEARNFVLCPGKAYDRSPCGTGTSAKLACLHADGAWEPGAPWRQQGILGSVFEGRYEPDPDGPGRVLPTITGRAHVTAESTLLLDPDDPFRWGIA